MSSNVKICMSPFEPPLATVEGLSFSMGPRYSAEQVSVTINPNITDYVEGEKKEGLEIAQMVQQDPSVDSFSITLNIKNHPEQKFSFNGIRYSIRFMGTEKEKIKGDEFTSYKFFVDKHELSDIQKEGSFTFNLSHEHKDWITNDNGYDFKSVTYKEIIASTKKNPDSNLILNLNGPLGFSTVFKQSIKDYKTDVIHVAVTWKGSAIKLYFNGEFIEETSCP